MAIDPLTDSSGGWPAPQLMRGLEFRDVGSSGLRQYSGWVREEFLPQLVGLQGARVYREMSDNNATVAAVIFAVTQLMRRVEWRVEAANDTPEAQKAADFVDSLRNDMSHTWEDFVAEALSMLVYGFAPHEIVYKRRTANSKQGRGEPDSLFNDGLIGWRRLPIRGQDTILKWYFDVNGMVEGLTQQPWMGTLIDIPIEKLLLFRPTVHKGNPEGRSVLRSSYRSYYFIKRLEELEAIAIERFGGLPTLYVPNALLEAASEPNADPVAKATLDQFKRIVRNVRIDEQMGVVLPSDLYKSDTGAAAGRMYELQFTVPTGARGMVNPELPIERYKTEILTTVLADFIKMGHEVRGTNNLATVKVDMFYSAIEGWLNSVADVINRYGIPRLWKLNGMDPELRPQLVPDLAQRVDLDSLGAYIGNLAKAGMMMFPDKDLENFLRDTAGMPDISDEAAYAASGDATDPNIIKRIVQGSIARRVAKQRGASVPT